MWGLQLRECCFYLEGIVYLQNYHKRDPDGFGLLQNHSGSGGYVFGVHGKMLGLSDMLVSMCSSGMLQKTPLSLCAKEAFFQ